MHLQPHAVIPPLAGLCDYERGAVAGYSVEENVNLLRRFNYVKRRLYEINAAFLASTPEWEIKTALSLHIWLDAEHSKSLRTRVTELREPPHQLDDIPDERLHDLLEEVLRSNSSLELVTAVYGVIRPALAEAVQEHLSKNNPLFDHPTHRLLGILLQEEKQMMDWGRQAIEALSSTEETRGISQAWKDHLHCFLACAGGVNGNQSAEPAILPQKRSTAPFTPSFDPKRDGRSGDIYNFSYRADAVYSDPEADFDERNLALMFKRFHEMDVPEMMASIVSETTGMPWDYYADMGRQIWDECRHALMGEVWFARNGVDTTRYPNHVGWSMYLNLDRTPLERHITLYGIEQSLMDGKTGKKYEWQIAQAANDELAVYFQDYDWADEVLHAQIGRRWLKRHLKEGESLMDLAAQIREKPSPTTQARAATTTQIDWWPRFVRDTLGKESSSQAGVNTGRHGNNVKMQKDG